MVRANFFHDAGKALSVPAVLDGVGDGVGEGELLDDDDEDDGGVQFGAWLELVEPHGTGPLFDEPVDEPVAGPPDPAMPLPSTAVEQAVRTRATDSTAARRMIMSAD